ncbi:sodium:sulfate symporter transmembrane region domain-containing protein [Phthorimaea operculella]|nr:sodium:sulfate symporter transmembrane region domain-containing protein [Phthorimaea operculella]
MEIQSDTSEDNLQMVQDDDDDDYNLVITTKKDKLKIFWKIYWRMFVLFGAGILFFPLLFLGTNSAYPCLYIFILTSTYWTFDVLHPAVVSMIPIGLSTIFGFYFPDFAGELHVHNDVMDCFGVMIMIVAIENSKIHRRIALKLLRIFGCSHYRLSFLLFFTCMFLSMWVTNIMACGLMLPIVKAILFELEKMGILEVYHVINKGRKQHNLHHEESKHRPTDFTIFYFLGIAYSSSIGGLATLIGNPTNEIFRHHVENYFPYAPKLEFPHYMLLNLPGVLLMETLLYLWMNFYFMGMFRAQSEIALEIGMTEEEAEYIHTLLSTQYQQLGKINFHQGAVASIVILAIILHVTREGISQESHDAVSSPVIFCVVLFFIIPTDLEFLKFFKSHSDPGQPYPTAPSKACLSWTMMRENIHWAVIFIAAGSCTMMEALKSSHMTEEFGKALMLMQSWPAPILVLMVILATKLLTEFANNSCVLFAILPSIARLSIAARVNPHCLMGAATLSAAVPFHLVSGAATNALVMEYMHIHPWKMMHAGLGPSVIVILVIWVTVTLWSRTIWPDITIFPLWGNEYGNLQPPDTPSAFVN